jgi:dynein heavy chain
VKKKIRDPSDFEWLKQSRFHWRADRDTVVTSICDVDFEYSYEYLGVQPNILVLPVQCSCSPCAECSSSAAC